MYIVEYQEKFDKWGRQIDKAFYSRYNNFDSYIWIPIAMILLALSIHGFNYVSSAESPLIQFEEVDNRTTITISEGEFLQKGTEFTGGTEIRYRIEETDFTLTEIEEIFASQGRPGTNALRETTGGEISLLVNVPPPEINDPRVAEEILRNNDIRNFTVNAESFTAVSASVSEEFFRQATLALILAFTIMSIVIFIAFKDFVPSIAVIFAAAGDIIIAAAGMAVLGIPLTLGSLAALLMLIGYSVDTDIVLSSRVLKKDRGELSERIWSSIKTGTTMSAGGIAAFTLLYFVSYSMVGSSELSNIAAVMVIGLLADLPITWLGNTVILKKYVEGDFENLSTLEQMKKLIGRN